jgi:hypothetical protein
MSFQLKLEMLVEPRVIFTFVSFIPHDNTISLDSQTLLTLLQLIFNLFTTCSLAQEQQLHQARRVKSERENTTYLSFGPNRRTMAYSNNGNEAVIVHRTILKAAMQANENSRFSSHLLRIYRKRRESCAIS